MRVVDADSDGTAVAGNDAVGGTANVREVVDGHPPLGDRRAGLRPGHLVDARKSLVQPIQHRLHRVIQGVVHARLRPHH